MFETCKVIQYACRISGHVYFCLLNYYFLEDMNSGNIILLMSRKFLEKYIFRYALISVTNQKLES